MHSTATIQKSTSSDFKADRNADSKDDIQSQISSVKEGVKPNNLDSFKQQILDSEKYDSKYPPRTLYRHRNPSCNPLIGDVFNTCTGGIGDYRFVRLEDKGQHGYYKYGPCFYFSLIGINSLNQAMVFWCRGTKDGFEMAEDDWLGPKGISDSFQSLDLLVKYLRQVGLKIDENTPGTAPETLKDNLNKI